MENLTAEERAIIFRRFRAYFRRDPERSRIQKQREKNWQLREKSPYYNPRPPPSAFVLYGLKFAFFCFPNRMIREMDLVQIIEFSLVSKLCRNQVKSCKIQGTNVTVAIRSEVVVCFELEEWGSCELIFWNWGSNVGEKTVKAPLKVEVTYFENNKRRVRWVCKDEFEMIDWMEHFYAIFNYRGIDSIKFDVTSFDYDPKDLKKSFGVPSILSMEHTFKHALNQAVLQTFLPVESLDMESYVFEDSKIPPEIFIQNFQTLKIREISRKVNTLDSLLMTNSKSIRIEWARIDQKDFNAFLKLWQQGANPQMEYLGFDNRIELDPTVILKGTKYMEISEDEGRWFRPSDRKVEKKNVRGGMEIVRNDGVRATIQIDVDSKCYEVFVWFDHCIVLEGPEFD
ncbi:unnamed protein product [Caenorhabditis brenneri]